jgi:O-antigen ligase
VASRPLPLPRHPPFAGVNATSARLSAIACGAVFALSTALAFDTKVGVAVLVALCFVPLALLRLRVAICAWVVLGFFSRTSALEAVPNKLLLLLVGSWLLLLAGRRAKARDMFSHGRVLIAWTLAFLVWTLITLAWAPSPSAAERPVKELLYAALGLVLIIGTVSERRHVRWVMAAFVAGAALSVLWGVAKGGLSSSGAANEVANIDGRFQGGAGDPNYLAALLVPALIFAGGLAIRRSFTQRGLLALATAILAVGLAATQSRGGLIAAGVCAVVALAIWRGRRGAILGLIGLAGLVVAVFFVANPVAWARIQSANQGSGRVDIWTVAWRVVQNHPIGGVGVAQFPVVSPHYTLLPGALQYVNLIVEKHIVVHNLYLQLWAETGIIGLLLFFGVVASSLASSWRAVQLFEAAGDREMSILSRATILAVIAMLTASFFLSNIEAGQFWILLALGPVLVAIAARGGSSSPEILTRPSPARVRRHAGYTRLVPSGSGGRM